MCGEYIAILAERQIVLFGNKWELNNNCNLSSWFHVDIMCYIKHTHVFIFRKKWRTAPPKNCRLTVGRLSFTAFYEDRKKWRTAPPKYCRPTVVYRLLRRSEKVKNSSPKKLSADCWSTVGQLLADSIPTVGRQTFRGALLHFYPFFSAFLFHLQMKKLYLTNKKVVN